MTAVHSAPCARVVFGAIALTVTVFGCVELSADLAESLMHLTFASAAYLGAGLMLKGRTVPPIAAPMTDPPFDAADFEAPATPRVAVVVENGKVEKIVVAESKIDVMVVDLDDLKNLPDDAINFETMEDMLTWRRISENHEEMGAVQDMVTQTFVDRGVTLT